MKRRNILIILILSLPILLPLYNPALELGFLGVILGFFGSFISPLIIFGTFLYLMFKNKMQ